MQNQQYMHTVASQKLRDNPTSSIELEIKGKGTLALK